MPPALRSTSHAKPIIPVITSARPSIGSVLRTTADRRGLPGRSSLLPGNPSLLLQRTDATKLS
jgi:hypothetical protein